jgi:hypothetical protein
MEEKRAITMTMKAATNAGRFCCNDGYTGNYNSDITGTNCAANARSKDPNSIKLLIPNIRQWTSQMWVR